MPIVKTHELTASTKLDNSVQQQTYCALDSMVMLECLDKMKPSLTPNAKLIYDFERALQAPLMQMMQTGWKINLIERDNVIKSLKLRKAKLQARLNALALEVWNSTLNPQSPHQLKEFLYKRMNLPEQIKSDKGEKKVSVNREALEKLDQYFYARPVVSTILTIRDLSKQISTLETEIDYDGRFRTSFNISTETGRLSSSANAFGTGGNLQNITEELRRVFVADPGYKLCSVDFSQTESRDIGWVQGTVLGDWKYLDACESSDLHTVTAKLIWPNLLWTGDPELDKALAEKKFYRNFSYRDMSKRGGHGSNYYGTPFTMARHLKVPTSIMEHFQDAYFEAFPGIPNFHRWVAQEIQTNRSITTAFGRVRTFFGRPDDDATLREAIAYCGQSPSADRTNLCVWRIWKYLRNKVQLLGQVHDAIIVQYKETENDSEIVGMIFDQLKVALTDQKTNRKLIIPADATIGWNWSKWHSETNPHGVKKFKLGMIDNRTAPDPFEITI